MGPLQVKRALFGSPELLLKEIQGKGSFTNYVCKSKWVGGPKFGKIANFTV